jgi:hypothetical protein
MNHTTQEPFAHHSGVGEAPGAVSSFASSEAEDTLRLIARLPAPEGLEERVQARLHTAPRTARILHFPIALRPGSDWMRSAAAAAIVFVVVGGGWGVYTRVQPPQPARVIAMPPHVATPGGFSNAGAMRTPNSLNGPVLAPPATVKPAQGKTPTRNAQKANHRAQANPAGKAAQPPAVPAAK